MRVILTLCLAAVGVAACLTPEAHTDARIVAQPSPVAQSPLAPSSALD